MRKATRIGIIGDVDPDHRSHQATIDSLRHAADHLSVRLDIQWVPTESLLDSGADRILGQYAGLWAAPGSPHKSQEGTHRGIRFARERNLPFIGT